MGHGLYCPRPFDQGREAAMNTLPLVLPKSPLAAGPLGERFLRVRAQTERLVAPLSAEDCQAQSMPDASPVKWHLAHVTWFFETFILERFEPAFEPFNASFRVLFNSYYNAIGDKHPRPQRGLLTRPSLDEVMQWRKQVDARVVALLAGPHSPELLALIDLGLHHEQQHQELLLTDLKHLLSCNALQPAYEKTWPPVVVAPVAASWVSFELGLKDIGHSGVDFAFDNETPKHRVWLESYELMNRLVTHGEWLEFMLDGGYTNSRWWLSAGWEWVLNNDITAPLYWSQSGDTSGPKQGWRCFTLHGSMPIDFNTPITHISYFEADAYARWKSLTDPAFAGARLPREAEWEAAVAADFEALRGNGNFLESRALHPLPVARQMPGLLQALGDVWEWTQTSYQAYPGFQAWEGAVGEYNGKFMVNQYVLRGGSCVTPSDHIRAHYRNFFPSDARWQFTGLRLARDGPRPHP
jgi:ergothioneine biosynthesis protein EgtB